MKRDLSQGIELYSKDVFQVLMDYELNRSKRYPSPLSLMDMWLMPSEQTQAIQQAFDSAVTSMLNLHLRSADIPAKIDDQYLILLPTTDEIGGRAVCERILSIFKGLIRTENNFTFSVSTFIGLATHSGGPDLSGDALMQQAAAALKHARQQGLSTYTIYSDISKNTITS